MWSQHKLVRGQSLQTEPLSGAARKGSPRPTPHPSRLGQRSPRQQKPPSHGSCEVVVKWWSLCVRPETPDHFQASSGFLGEKEPKAGFGGFASAPRPSPRPLEPRRSPHPAFRDLCQGGSGDPIPICQMGNLRLRKRGAELGAGIQCLHSLLQTTQELGNPQEACGPLGRAHKRSHSGACLCASCCLRFSFWEVQGCR